MHKSDLSKFYCQKLELYMYISKFYCQNFILNYNLVLDLTVLMEKETKYYCLSFCINNHKSIACKALTFKMLPSYAYTLIMTENYVDII